MPVYKNKNVTLIEDKLRKNEYKRVSIMGNLKLHSKDLYKINS